MKITLSPIRMDTALSAEVAGDVLILNGVAHDFSAVTETEPLEAHEHAWIVGPVRRIAGELEVTLLLPHGATPPQETLFPRPITLREGPVALPPFDGPAPGEESDPAGMTPPMPSVEG